MTLIEYPLKVSSSSISKFPFSSLAAVEARNVINAIQKVWRPNYEKFMSFLFN